MKIGIMQPYFLPYIGYWQLLAAVDVFVVYDNIQYTKKGWINRNRFLRNGHDELFTIPLKKDSDFLDIRQRVLSQEYDRNRLLNQFAGSYRKSPHFQSAFPLISEIVQNAQENLFDYIFNSIQLMARHLDINVEIVISSALDMDHSLRGENRVIGICRAMGASHYINAIGGRDLYSKDHFSRSGVELSFIQSRPVGYEQFGDTFLPNLSIVDVLMFNHVSSVRSMLDEYDLV